MLFKLVIYYWHEVDDVVDCVCIQLKIPLFLSLLVLLPNPLRILTKVTINTVVQKMDPTAPGPQDPSVLTMQEEHRSTPLWDADVSIMFCINCTLIMSETVGKCVHM